MAGQTKGTYRSKATGGKGVPTPPVINLAWLKSWWEKRENPNAREKQKPQPGNVGKTKSERRALLKAKLGVKRLPPGMVVA